MQQQHLADVIQRPKRTRDDQNENQMMRPVQAARVQRRNDAITAGRCPVEVVVVAVLVKMEVVTETRADRMASGRDGMARIDGSTVDC